MKDSRIEHTRLLTAREMRRIEAAAIARGATTGRDLMQRAAGAVVDSLHAQGWGSPGRAVVVCGPGNNGGDGYAVARRLAGQGWAVRLLATAPPGPGARDAAAEAAAWAPYGRAEPFTEDTAPIEADIAVDALFGTGLSRPLSPALATTWAAVVKAERTVAVDMPSGLCSDTGLDRGIVAAADLTVTFQAAKRGHYVGAGPDMCGSLAIADIGLSDEDMAAGGPITARLANAEVHKLRKLGARHKYAHGHALVLAGGVGHGGAARLAARGALRVGAGLVTLGVSGAAMIENAARLDAVMLRRIDDAAALAAILEDRRFNAIVLGPGLGVGERSARLVLTALAARHPQRTVVLDADALSSFSGDPSRLWSATRGTSVVLTPHDGEFGRLFPDLAGYASGRIAAAQAAAERSGAIILLKGRDTIIAPPDGPAVVSAAAYDRAAPWLATAGSGDVLAGMIAGLAARGIDLPDAVEMAAVLHVEAARRFGPGLIAEDLPECVPLVFRDLGV